jgi:hypothetical protein
MDNESCMLRMRASPLQKWHRCRFTVAIVGMLFAGVASAQQMPGHEGMPGMAGAGQSQETDDA